ncbi:MAG: hypothetical protein Kow00105_09090 [Phycisphaeraceae bacterium]
MKNQIGIYIAAVVMSGGLVVDSANALTIDFDHDAQGDPILAGQFIEEEFADWGVHIRAHNYSRRHNAAIAFDSLNPTGGDYDLRTDDRRYGVNNDRERGMVLILAEDIRDRNRDGYVDDPDDEGRRPAGYFDFVFDQVMNSGSVVMLDIDNKCEPGSVSFYLGDSVLDQSFDFIALGDNSIQTLDWSGFEYDKMRINLGGSGAVAEVSANPVPEPVTAVLTAGALTALGMRTTGRRRRKREETN